MRCAGILLTGGRSTRMGRDKATIVLGTETLAARAARALQDVCAETVEVGSGVSGLPTVRDNADGPLAAFAAGIAALGTSQPVILLACDLPLVDAALIRWLADHPGAGSVVPLWRDRPQPLCARWSPAAQAMATTWVAGGARAMRDLLDLPDIELVPSDAAGLTDVDTEADLKAVTDRYR